MSSATSAALAIRFERLTGDAFTVTDRARPWRVLVVYRDRDPDAFDALRELELCTADVTPRREAHLLGLVAAAWRARDARRSPRWAGHGPATRPAA